MKIVRFKKVESFRDDFVAYIQGIFYKVELFFISVKI